MAVIGPGPGDAITAATGVAIGDGTGVATGPATGVAIGDGLGLAIGTVADPHERGEGSLAQTLASSAYFRRRRRAMLRFTSFLAKGTILEG